MAAVASARLCRLEGCSRPVYVEGSITHDYCSFSHYKKDKKQSTSDDLMCSTPGCTRPKCRTSSGTYYDYCSKSCRDGRTNLSSPRPPAKFNPAKFEEECRIVPASLTQYRNHCQQFLKTWVKGQPPPQHSISVYIILNPKLTKKWQKYKKTLSVTDSEINYHGTKLCCDISSAQLCSDESCGICGIAQYGFRKSLIGSNISRFQRFGRAFYLAPHSSKCHDYTVGYHHIRAILCFDTLPGHSYQLKKTDVTFQLPPGYDSARGVAGDSLNYPELMLYNSDAALPICIITYKKDGIHQIAT